MSRLGRPRPGAASRARRTDGQRRSSRPRASGYVAADLGEVPEERAAIVDWFDDGAARLLDVLGSTDPTTPVWSWGEDQHARFWARRMAHETAVHGWDSGNPAGSDRAIAGDVAVDGIDEQLDNVPFMVAFRPEVAGLRGAGESIHLHATDAEGEWLIRLVSDGIEVSREHAKGDVAAHGTASDLFLFLVGRVSPTALEVFGDAALLDRWQTRLPLLRASRSRVRCRASGEVPPSAADEEAGTIEAGTIEAGTIYEGSSALRRTSMTCSRRSLSMAGESGSSSSNDVMSGASERYDSTAP